VLVIDASLNFAQISYVRLACLFIRKLSMEPSHRNFFLELLVTYTRFEVCTPVKVRLKISGVMLCGVV